MAHEVESMFYMGETPWHGLGTKVDKALTFDEAMKVASLDWNVKALPLYFKHGNNPITQAIDSKIVVRESDGTQLGTVGADYSVIQNDEALRPIYEALQRCSDKVTIETAGSLRNGRKVWMLWRLNEAKADVIQGDAVTAYLLAATSHDGSMAHITQFTATRVVCANTLAAAIGTKGESRIRVYHKGNAADTVKQVAELINASQRTFEASVEQYRALARKAISLEDIEKYVRVVFNIPKPEQGQEDTSKLVPKIVELAHTGIGMDLPGVRGTLWAAYNAVTEQLTHHRGRSQDTRLDSLAFGQSAQLNTKALQAALDMAA